MVGIWPYFIISLQKFGGPPPKKFGGEKHAKFRSILDHFRLWSQISPERLKISKTGKLMFRDRFLCVQWKRSGELWSTNDIDLDVSLDSLKCTFLAYYISTLRGCCALKFLHALEIDQVLLAHIPSWAGVPPKKNFNHENWKSALKFSLLNSITSGLVGVSSRDFFQSTPRERGVINWVQFLQCPPIKICDGQKIAQNFSPFLTTFDFDRESTYQKWEKLLIIYNPSHVRPKNLAYFGPQTKKLLTVINVHHNGIFSGNYISALRACCAMKFLYALQIDKCYLARTPTGTGVPPKKF